MSLENRWEQISISLFKFVCCGMFVCFVLFLVVALPCLALYAFYFLPPCLVFFMFLFICHILALYICCLLFCTLPSAAFAFAFLPFLVSLYLAFALTFTLPCPRHCFVWWRVDVTWCGSACWWVCLCVAMERFPFAFVFVARRRHFVPACLWLR